MATVVSVLGVVVWSEVVVAGVGAGVGVVVVVAVVVSVVEGASTVGGTGFCAAAILDHMSIALLDNIRF